MLYFIGFCFYFVFVKHFISMLLLLLLYSMCRPVLLACSFAVNCEGLLSFKHIQESKKLRYTLKNV